MPVHVLESFIVSRCSKIRWSLVSFHHLVEIGDIFVLSEVGRSVDDISVVMNVVEVQQSITQAQSLIEVERESLSNSLNNTVHVLVIFKSVVSCTIHSRIQFV